MGINDEHVVCNTSGHLLAPRQTDLSGLLAFEANPVPKDSTPPLQEVRKKARVQLRVHPDTVDPTGPSRTTEPAAACVSDQYSLCFLTSVHSQLLMSLNRLRAYHQACELIPDEVVHLALGVFRHYTQALGLSCRDAILHPLQAQATLGACLWVSLKFLSMPGTVPNSTFMGSAAGVPGGLLVPLELRVLQTVGWRLYGLCRAVGLAPPTSAPEEGSLEERSTPGVDNQALVHDI